MLIFLTRKMRTVGQEKKKVINRSAITLSFKRTNLIKEYRDLVL